MILVTGGAGFIGSNFVLHWLRSRDEPVVVVDKLTYAGNLENLADVAQHPAFALSRTDICDRAAIAALLGRYRPGAVLHFAAETHVDRSIAGPARFVHTNVQGTFELLEAARTYHSGLAGVERDGFRFVHVSTDEVYGSLAEHEPPFTEATAYSPRSPYSASKAASDHLVRTYHHTYGLPTLVTNCGNNYGPHQFPEKLIPLAITHALDGKPLPIYGDGRQVRDWLYVVDHCDAIARVLRAGRVGETYNVGANCQRRNIEVVTALCNVLDELAPRRTGSHADLIEFVADRPGHDRRYAIDASKITRELGWTPTETFDSGLRKTVQWYLSHSDWIARVRDGRYREWIAQQYGQGHGA